VVGDRSYDLHYLEGSFVFQCHFLVIDHFEIYAVEVVCDEDE
jgi:hypothetical protein